MLLDGQLNSNKQRLVYASFKGQHKMDWFWHKLIIKVECYLKWNFDQSFKFCSLWPYSHHLQNIVLGQVELWKKEF